MAPHSTMVGIFGRPSPSAASRPWIGIGVWVSSFGVARLANPLGSVQQGRRSGELREHESARNEA